MRLFRLFFIIPVLLLGACAELQNFRDTGTTANVEVVERAAATGWLESVHALRDVSPAEQQRALKNWEQAFMGNPDFNNRMRLAVLLATGGEEVRDSRRARQLLDEIDPPLQSDSDRETVALLGQWLDERAEARRKLNILWKQVTAQSRRVEELEQQLQALTTIEQNIQSRDAPVVLEDER